ncbi:kinesin-domain-containing protein [Nadsonia fulvescens var. elongata DSM 6958]|uniref:Kinesin-domain-containing protein n=1 Tax=Nadsonia fulvescens var. elongata DSM 6958 TaxID=857566 RepID=A0A1E3PD47_9ASCO|nr:kinesin-domain-containing protein [Nadsonia fulvescens var. elongata DSM 6958]
MERKTNIALKNSLTEVSVSSASLESITASLKARIDELQIELTTKDSDSIQMRNLMVQAQQERDEAKSRLLTEETLRRKLHNQIQDLKGKFRVFCRVRPAHSNAADGEKIEVADIVYPDERADGQEIQIYGPSSESAMGNITTKVHPFSFDKVFTPRCDNEEVFLEISQLVQSALDGYNVCIFAYGQTGSGKTHTMSSHDGMIPRAVEQIFQTCEGLKEKGWKYMLEGQFLEIYNENINDLLGKPNRSEKINHEIRHDVKEQKTVVTDLTTATLDSPEKVIAILRQADNNRSVAATKSNERSSRSHSVFILKIQGKNYLTGEQCNGILNLVDLAGSERLSQSQAIGERLKETQAINKSLSCLGDVIYAMSNSREGAHIPYRNSKLTYLLQYSLSGNSKTLMFVNVSPLKQHANETINSLRFATKVNNTQITSVRTVRGMSPTKN